MAPGAIAEDWAPLPSVAAKKDTSKCPFGRCTEAELESLRHAFRMYDLNGDGKVSKDEILAVMEKLGTSCTESDISQLLEQIGTCTSDCVSFENFVKLNLAAKDCCEETANELEEAFKVFDLNADGFISPDELRAVLSSIGTQKATLADCKRMIKRFDKNGDGKVDMTEFEKMMQEEIVS